MGPDSNEIVVQGKENISNTHEDVSTAFTEKPSTEFQISQKEEFKQLVALYETFEQDQREYQCEKISGRTVRGENGIVERRERKYVIKELAEGGNPFELELTICDPRARENLAEVYKEAILERRDTGDSVVRRSKEFGQKEGKFGTWSDFQRAGMEITNIGEIPVVQMSWGKKDGVEISLTKLVNGLTVMSLRDKNGNYVTQKPFPIKDDLDSKIEIVGDTLKQAKLVR